MANREVTIDIRTLAQAEAIGTLIDEINRLKGSLSEVGSGSSDAAIGPIENISKAIKDVVVAAQESSKEITTAITESAEESDVRWQASADFQKIVWRQSAEARKAILADNLAYEKDMQAQLFANYQEWANRGVEQAKAEDDEINAAHTEALAVNKQMTKNAADLNTMVWRQAAEDHKAALAEEQAAVEEAAQVEAQAIKEAAAQQEEAQRVAAEQMQASMNIMKEAAIGLGTALSEALGSGAELAGNAMRTFEETAMSGLSTLRENILETGSVFRIFGTDVETGMSRAEAATKSFYAAGWSLIMIGQQISMVGKQIGTSLSGDLSKYIDYEKNITQAAIATTGAGDPNNSQVLFNAVADMQQNGIKINGQSMQVWTQSANDIAKGIYILGSATGETIKTAADARTDIQRLVPMLQAASISQTDPETAIKGFLSFAQEYGINPSDSNASQAQRDATTAQMNQLVAASLAVVQQTPLEMSDLVGSMKMVGPLAHFFSGDTTGKDMYDTLAIFGTLSQYAVKGTRAGTGFQQILGTLANPSIASEANIESAFGQSSQDTFFNPDGTLKGGLIGFLKPIMALEDEKLKGDQDAAAKLSDFYKALPANARRNAVALISGIEQAGGMSAINAMSAGYQGIDPMEMLSQSVAMQHDTIFANLDNLRNAFFQMNAGIIQSIEGPLKAALFDISAMVWKVRDAIVANPWIGELIAGFGAFAAILLTVVGTLLTFGGGLILVSGAISKMGGSLEAFTGLLEIVPAMFGSMLPILILLTVAGIAAFDAWKYNLGGVQDLVSNLGNTVRNDLLPALLDVANFILHTGMAFDEFISGILLGVGPMQDLQAWLVQLFGQDTADTIFSYLTDFGTYMDGIRTSVEAFFTSLPQYAGTAISSLEDFGKRAVAVFVGLSVEIAHSGIFQTIAENIASVFDGQNLQAVKDFMSGFVTGIAEGLAGVVLAFLKFVEYLSQLFANMPGYIKNIADFVDGLTHMSITAKSLGDALGIGFGIFLGGELIASLTPIVSILDTIITGIVLFTVDVAEAAIGAAAFGASLAFDALTGMVEFTGAIIEGIAQVLAFAVATSVQAVVGIAAFSAEALASMATVIIWTGLIAALILTVSGLGTILSGLSIGDAFSAIGKAFSDMFAMLESPDGWNQLGDYLSARATQAIQIMAEAFYQGIENFLLAYEQKIASLPVGIGFILGKTFGTVDKDLIQATFGSEVSGIQNAIDSENTVINLQTKMDTLLNNDPDIFHKINESVGFKNALLNDSAEQTSTLLDNLTGLWTKYNDAVAGGATATTPGFTNFAKALTDGNAAVAAGILGAEGDLGLTADINKGIPLLASQAKAAGTTAGGAGATSVFDGIVQGFKDKDPSELINALSSIVGVNLGQAAQMASDLFSGKTSISDIASKFATSITGINLDGSATEAIKNQMSGAMLEWNNLINQFASEGVADPLAAATAAWEKDHKGEPIPTDPSFKDWVANQIKQDAAALDALDKWGAGAEATIQKLTLPQITDMFTQKQNLGDTSLADVFATQQSNIDNYLQNYHYATGSGTNTIDLLSHATTAFIGGSLAGVNVATAIQNDPGIQQWAAEAGIDINDFIANIISNNGGSKFIADPRLQGAETMDLTGFFANMKFTGKDALLQTISQGLDINWTDLMNYAGSMGQKPWNLEDFLVANGWSKADAEAWFKNNAVDPNVVGSSIFPDISDQILSNYGQYNVLTKQEFDTYNALIKSEQTDAGGSNYIEMTSAEWMALPDAIKAALEAAGIQVVVGGADLKAKIKDLMKQVRAALAGQDPGGDGTGSDYSSGFGTGVSSQGYVLGADGKPIKVNGDLTFAQILSRDTEQGTNDTAVTEGNAVNDMLAQIARDRQAIANTMVNVNAQVSANINPPGDGTGMVVGNPPGTGDGTGGIGGAAAGAGDGTGGFGGTGSPNLPTYSGVGDGTGMGSGNTWATSGGGGGTTPDYSNLPAPVIPNIPNLPTPGAAAPVYSPASDAATSDTSKAGTIYKGYYTLVSNVFKDAAPTAQNDGVTAGRAFLAGVMSAMAPAATGASQATGSLVGGGQGSGSTTSGPFDGMFKGFADSAVTAFTTEITGDTGISSALNKALGNGQTAGKSQGGAQVGAGPFDEQFKTYAYQATVAFGAYLTAPGTGLAAKLSTLLSSGGGSGADASAGGKSAGPFDATFKDYATSAVTAFMDVLDGGKGGAGGLGQLLSTAILDVKNSAMNSGKGGQYAGGMPFDDVFKGYATSAVTKFMDVINGGKGGAGGLSSLLSESLAQMKGAGMDQGKGGAYASGFPFDAMFQAYATSAVKKFMDVINGGGTAGDGIAQQIATALATAASGGGGVQGGIAGGPVGATNGTVGPFDAEFLGYATTAVAAFMKELGVLPADVGNLLTDIANTILFDGGKAVSAATTVGVNIGQGLVVGLNSQQAAVEQAAAALTTAATASANRNVGNASPSKVWIVMGQFMSQGLGIGIENGIPGVSTSAARVSSAATNAVNLNNSIRTVPARAGGSSASAGNNGTIQVRIDNLTVSKEADINAIMNRLETLMGKKIEMVVRGQAAFDDTIIS